MVDDEVQYSMPVAVICNIGYHNETKLLFTSKYVFFRRTIRSMGTENLINLAQTERDGLRDS